MKREKLTQIRVKNAVNRALTCLARPHSIETRIYGIWPEVDLIIATLTEDGYFVKVDEYQEDKRFAVITVSMIPFPVKLVKEEVIVTPPPPTIDVDSWVTSPFPTLYMENENNA